VLALAIGVGCYFYLLKRSSERILFRLTSASHQIYVTFSAKLESAPQQI
jgi:hypothetical protein